MNTMQSVKQRDLALAGLYVIFLGGKTWNSRRHTHWDKRPGFLNGAGFRPRRP